MEAAGLSGPGELDVLDGSPPCQGFSTAGKRDLWDPRNELYREFARLLEGTKPRAFVMENVSGMVKGKMKLAFADCTRALKAAGYRVSCRLLDAKWFLVPQERKRLIWVGVREDLETEPSHPKAESEPLCALCCIKDVDDAVENPAGPRKFNMACRKLTHHRPSPTLDANALVPGSAAPFDDKGRRIGAERYAVIGSYSNDFKFVGSWKNKMVQIGNSVPPLFMRAIAAHVAGLLLAT